MRPMDKAVVVAADAQHMAGEQGSTRAKASVVAAGPTKTATTISMARKESTTLILVCWWNEKDVT